MATFLSAKNAVVRINGVTIVAKSWNVDPKVDPLDVTNFEGNGFGDYIAGIIDCDIEVSGDWDSASSQLATFVVGNTLTNVLLYTNGVGSAKWTFPSVLVVGSPQQAEVRSALSFSFSGKTKGSFTYLS